MPINYHALTREKKDAFKALVAELRKHLYSSPDVLLNTKNILKDGLVINYGKNQEERITVKVSIVA